MSEAQNPRDIQLQMEAIRADLRVEMDEMRESARVLTDWRHYVRNYPWACLGAAAAVGYLVVPRRLEVISPNVATLEALAKNNRLVVNSKPQPDSRPGAVGKIFSFVASLAVRGALAYAGQQLGKIVGHQAADGSQGEFPYQQQRTP